MKVFEQITRRGWLGLMAGAAAAPAIVTSKNRVDSPACQLTPEVTEGPYYVDYGLIRSDVSEGRPGIPLQLEIVVVDGHGCQAVPNAAVSIWHCDAAGVYSGYTKQSVNGPPGMPPGGPLWQSGERLGPPPGPAFGVSPHHGPIDGTRFFRGTQVADARGQVTFSTIYPGWYMGRDTHIHLKVHMAGHAASGQYVGGHVCHTGQLFFPDDLSDAVARVRPYSAHAIERTRQQEDGVFLSQDASGSILALAQMDARDLAGGFRTRVVIGVDPEAEPRPVGFGGPRGS